MQTQYQYYTINNIEKQRLILASTYSYFKESHLCVIIPLSKSRVKIVGQSNSVVHLFISSSVFDDFAQQIQAVKIQTRRDLRFFHHKPIFWPNVCF